MIRLVFLPFSDSRLNVVPVNNKTMLIGFNALLTFEVEIQIHFVELCQIM